MPLLRGEQLRNLTLRDLQIANDAGIKQHKIENWQNEPAGWISKGIIKPVTTANLPQWDGSQAGQMYYDTNTNELFIGITIAPYFQLIAGTGNGAGSGVSDRIIVVKMANQAENWSGSTAEDISGTGSIFSLDTDKVATDGSNLIVYLNGILQERGSGNDFIIYEEGGITKLQFTYNIEGPDQKMTAIIGVDERLVNYATKHYVDNKFFGASGHDHDGTDSNQLDFNSALTSNSLNNIIHSIKPATPAVDLGSPTQKFGKIYAQEGHFDANTIYLGNVAISGTGDTFSVSTDGGQTYSDVPVSGSTTEPSVFASGTGQPVVLESSVGIIAKGPILPEMTGASGDVSVRDVGSPTARFRAVYADEVFVGASSLYVNGKKVIEDVSNEMTFQTSQNQAMAIKTDAATKGTGNANITIESGNEFNAVAFGGMEWVVPSTVPTKQINFTNQSIGGNITFTATGTNGAIQAVSGKSVSLNAPLTDVTGNIDIAGDADITGDLSVTGNLTVVGTTTILKSEVVTVDDNIILLNGNVTGVPTENAGIEIERGSSTNYQFLFDETSDMFKVGEVGSLQVVATREDNPSTNNGIAVWNSSQKRFDTSTVTISGTAISADIVGNVTGHASQDLPLTGGTLTNAIEPQLKLANSGSGNVSLEFNGGTNANWKIIDDVGTLKFKTDYTTVKGAYFDALTISTNTGNISSIGQISAQSFVGPLTGNASTATKLTTARTISLSGNVTGSTTFDGSGNTTITTIVSDNSHNHLSSDITDATEANSTSKIVRRDASGNFAAGVITASLIGNASTATKLATPKNISISGKVTGTATSFDGSGNITIATTAASVTSAEVTDATSLNTSNMIIKRDAAGNFSASTISASLAGNANTATSLLNDRNITLSGDVTGTASFDGGADALITATVVDDSHNHTTLSGVTSINGVFGGNMISSTDEWLRINSYGDHTNGVYFGNSFVRTDGTFVVGTTTKASNSVMSVLAGDSSTAGFEAYGLDQGTGYFYAGQSSTSGGGFIFSGDVTPALMTGQLQDTVTFYRKTGGVNEAVFSYPVGSNDVTFRGEITSNASIIGGMRLEDSQDRSGLLEINRLGSTSWTGIQNRFSPTSLWSVMSNENQFGIYDDSNSKFSLLTTENAGVDLYYNGTSTLSTTPNGVTIVGEVFTNKVRTGYSTQAGNVYETTTVDLSTNSSSQYMYILLHKWITTTTASQDGGMSNGTFYLQRGSAGSLVAVMTNISVQTSSYYNNTSNKAMMTNIGSSSVNVALCAVVYGGLTYVAFRIPPNASTYKVAYSGKYITASGYTPLTVIYDDDGTAPTTLTSVVDLAIPVSTRTHHNSFVVSVPTTVGGTLSVSDTLTAQTALVVGKTGVNGALSLARSSDGNGTFTIENLFGESRYSQSAGSGIHTWYTNASSSVGERMRLTSEGQLMIGGNTDIISPATGRLFVENSAAAAGISVTTWSNDSTADSAYLRLTKVKSDTVGALAASVAGDLTGVISFSGVDSAASARRDGFYIRSYIENVGSNYINNDLRFDALTNGTITERMRITNGGNVLIGTTGDYGYTNTNVNSLIVAGTGAASANTTGVLALVNNRATEAVGDLAGLIHFVSQSNGSTDTSRVAGLITTRLEGSGGTNGFGGRLSLGTKKDAVLGIVEHVFLTSAGDVGIGVSDPYSKLEVLDQIRVTSVNTEASLTTTRINGSRTSPTPILSGQTIGQLAFVGQWGSVAGARVVGAQITAHAAANWTSTANAKTHLVFSTNGGTALEEEMRLTDDGQLFLGATSAVLSGLTASPPRFVSSYYSPSYHNVANIAHFGANTLTSVLSLQKSRGTTNGELLPTTTNDTLGWLTFGGVNTSNTSITGATIRTIQDGIGSASYIPGKLIFSTSDGVTAGRIDRMTIDKNGAVEISAATAGKTLTVSGDISTTSLSGVTRIDGAFGTMMKSTDEWLRINDDSSHTTGVYFGNSEVRTDGDFRVGTTSKTSSSTMYALAGDGYRAGFEAYGSSQGSGYFYAGQSSTYGGGFTYDGDATPAIMTGQVIDEVTFFRKNAGVNEAVFSYPYNSNTVSFRGDILVGTATNTGSGDRHLVISGDHPSLSLVSTNVAGGTFEVHNTYSGGVNVTTMSGSDKLVLNAAEGGVALSGPMVIDSYSVRKVVTKVVPLAGTSTPIFTITTTNETGSTDGGAYTCFIKATVSNPGAGNGIVAMKYWSANFIHINNNAGTAVTGALQEVFSSASVSSASATRDIGAITVTTAATSNYITTVNFGAIGTGTTPQDPTITAEIHVIYSGYTTAPVITLV